MDSNFNQNGNYNPNMPYNGPKTLSIWSMISGISSWILMFIPGWLSLLSFITPIVAIVLAVIAKGKEGKNGFRTAGLVLGICSIAGFFLLIILIVILFAIGFNFLQEFDILF